jgi:mannose-6-phosphate isomerase-like protein (cupin superfamily)
VSEKVNLAETLAKIDDHWRPRIVARVNDNEVRVVKVRGEFVWHRHEDSDDFFLVLEGHVSIRLRDRVLELEAGELAVVPRGVEHCPVAAEEASLLLIEAAGTVNTGDAHGPLTAEATPT